MKHDDLSTPGGIVLAVYRLISGRRDQRRDWDRMREFLHPQARMRPVMTGPDGQHSSRLYRARMKAVKRRTNTRVNVA